MCRYIELSLDSCDSETSDKSVEFQVQVGLSDRWRFKGVCPRNTRMTVLRQKLADALEVEACLIGLVCFTTNRAVSGRECVGDQCCVGVRWAVNPNKRNDTWGFERATPDDFVLRDTYNRYFRCEANEYVDLLNEWERGYDCSFTSGREWPVTFQENVVNWLSCRVATNALLGEFTVIINCYWKVRHVKAELYKFLGVDPTFMILKKSGESAELDDDAAVIQEIYGENCTAVLQLSLDVEMMVKLVAGHPLLCFFR